MSYQYLNNIDVTEGWWELENHYALALWFSNVTEGWFEIDKHYSLELCFSIEKQPETVWRGGV